MSKPRTLDEYKDWFAGWAGWDATGATRYCGSCGADLVTLGLVMTVAAKKGYRAWVLPPGDTGDGEFLSHWRGECLDGEYRSYWADARYHPACAALRALYQAVKENE